MKKFLLGLVFVFSLSAGGVSVAQTELEVTDPNGADCFNGRIKIDSNGLQSCVWRGKTCMR